MAINEEGLVVRGAVQERNREIPLFRAKTRRVVGVVESHPEWDGVDGFDADEEGPIRCDADVGARISHRRILVDAKFCRMG
jgi:hypothetical protein